MKKIQRQNISGFLSTVIPDLNIFLYHPIHPMSIRVSIFPYVLLQFLHVIFNRADYVFY